MSRVTQPKIPSPVPVVPGPVQPPHTRSTWWVYVLMLVFLILAAIAVFAVKWKMQGGTEEIPVEESGVEESSDALDEEEKIYSYLSVVTATPQVNYYQGTEEECLVSVRPEAPADIVEPMYFVARVNVTESFDRLAEFVALLNRHKIPLTISVSSGEIAELAAWSEQGHEIALLLDANLLFADSTTPPAYGTWLSALHDLRDEAEAACACDVTSWSGEEWYERIFDVATQLGFTTTMDWQDTLGRVPNTLAVTNPWTPARSDSVEGLTEFDPEGSIVYLPAGYYPSHCSGSLVEDPFAAGTLHRVTRSLYNSLRVSVDQKVNLFQIVFDTTTFNPALDVEEFTALDAWLTDVIDPLVSSRFLLPATASETAAAYTSWAHSVVGTITPVYLEER